MEHPNNNLERGMRFVCRAPEQFAWVHQLEMLPTDIDCTHMDDAEFDAFVDAQQGTTLLASKEG